MFFRNNSYNRTGHYRLCTSAGLISLTSIYFDPQERKIVEMYQWENETAKCIKISLYCFNCNELHWRINNVATCAYRWLIVQLPRKLRTTTSILSKTVNESQVLPNLVYLAPGIRPPPATGTLLQAYLLEITVQMVSHECVELARELGTDM